MVFRHTLKLFRLVLINLLMLLNLSAHALVGGTSVDSIEYPGLVMLSYSGNAWLKNCSGIVLEPKRVLTSVSCINHFSIIPASDIYVHRVLDGQTSGSFLLPPLKPISSDAKVISYAAHPQNPYSSGHHNLVVLYLDKSINLEPAILYNGQNKFIGSNAIALGWKEEQGIADYPFQRTYYFYQLEKLTFKLVEANADSNGSCYDNYNYTGTVFCGGFRNSKKFMEYSQDYGSPIYKTINAKKAAIGILASASHGSLFQGKYEYERYARISSMISFIKQHAPNTRFHNESIVAPKPKINTLPMLQLLLLSKE